MENPGDVVSPFVWLDGDGIWNDLLAMVFSGSAWPEGSETAVWELAQEWTDLAHGLADASDQLQTAAGDLLAAWDAPATGTFDDLARQLLGSPDVGLPGHLQNAAAIARQVSGFGVDLQYAKVSVNIAVAVAAMAAVIAFIAAPLGGLSLTTLGPAAQLGRQAVLRALEQLATAAGRRAAVQEVGQAVADAAVSGVQRVATTVAGHAPGHHLVHEVIEETLEELVIDVGTQTYQMSEGTRTDWNGLSTVMSAVGGGVGGAVGAGVVAPVFARLRSTPRIAAVAGLGADGRFLARTGNAGVRLGGGLVATASTNVVASPAGGITASLLTGQGFPALDGSTFGMAALGALGRYGTVSPTNPAVLSAAVHPVEALARVHLDALAGHTGQRTVELARTVGGTAAPVDHGFGLSDRPSTGLGLSRTTVPPVGVGASVAAPVPAGPAPTTAAATTPSPKAPGVPSAGPDFSGDSAPSPAAASATTTPQPPSAGESVRAGWVDASPDELARGLTSVAAPRDVGQVSRADLAEGAKVGTDTLGQQVDARTGNEGIGSDDVGAVRGGGHLPAVRIGDDADGLPDAWGSHAGHGADGGVHGNGGGHQVREPSRGGDPAGSAGDGPAGRPDPGGRQERDGLGHVGGLSPAGGRATLFSSRAGGLSNAEAATLNTEVPQSVESIVDVARLLGLDLSGVVVGIASEPDEIRMFDAYGLAGSLNVGLDDEAHVLVGPAAFVSTETFVRTVAHELHHVQQLRDGRIATAGGDSVAGLEDEADGIEVGVWQQYQDVAGRPGTSEPALGAGPVGEEPPVPTGEGPGESLDASAGKPEHAGVMAGGPPPADPPSTERALYDGMPEALRRYLVEAVAHGQVWADLVEDQLADVVVHLAELGLPVAEAVGLANAVKSLESAARKIQPSIQGGSTVASTIWSMDDLVRFSLRIDPERYGDSVLEALARFRALGWAVPEVPAAGQQHDDWRNTWAIGNRHHGLLVVMTHAETGQRVEMQFPTPQSWAVGKQTHEFYEVMRFTEGNSLERVHALAQIRDIVAAEQVEDSFPRGLGELGTGKPNGADKVFSKEPALARRFLVAAAKRSGSAESFLRSAGVSIETAREVVLAATEALSGPTKEGESDDGLEPPRLAPLADGATEGQGTVGADPGTQPTTWSSDPPGLPNPSGGPGPGASGHVGPDGRRGAGGGEGLHIPDRDLAEARDQADLGEPLGGGRRPGDDPVRRPQPPVDLGPGERERDGAPGGRGPVRPAGAGDPGGSGSPGPAEGDDAADPGATAGDVPQPGGPGAGHVGDPGGPGEAARPAALTGPLAVGADATLALEHVLGRAKAPVLWEGLDGVLPGRVVRLADGSTVRINTGPNPWARTDPDRPLQMWTVGAFHLDDGPLTPAASAFLGDLATALRQPDAGDPSSHWLAQRATLDPRTHRITEPGVARPQKAGEETLVWDAAQGWVDAPRAGGLARVIGERLVPGAVFAHWAAAGAVVAGAEHAAELIRETEAVLAPHQEARERRAELRGVGEQWVAESVGPTMAVFLNTRVRVLAESDGRQLIEVDGDRLAVVTVAVAENDALSGSRPGLQQAGTTADIGRLRNELAERGWHAAAVSELTRQLQQGVVRHFRVQGVLAASGFVGMRVTEFEVTRPAHDEPGVLRTRVEPHRHIDPGLFAREAMQRAVAGWTPHSVTDAITNALRWLPFVNPHHDRYPVSTRMPWSNNCGDCSRAVADLLHGRDARAAFGDNGARVLDDHRFYGTDPGELHEMWRWAGVQPAWHHWQEHAAVYSPEYTAAVQRRVGKALSAHPEGTVAIVLVNWADEHGKTVGGHWFNAAVTEHGVEWVDGQTAQHGAWPPPHTRPVSGVAVITRAAGSDTWTDLLGGTHPGPTPLDDATLAARLANYTGDWPDEDDVCPWAPVHE